MTKLAIMSLCLSLPLLFPVQTLALPLAQTSQQSATPADDCVSLARACSGAAKELKAAKEYIKGLEANIEAANERIEIARKQIGTLRQAGQIEAQRAAELEKVIKAEQAQKDLLIEEKELLEKRIAQLDKQLKRSRKFGLIAGIAAGVAILIAASK